MVDEALEELSPLLAELYARTGRPSIPPERRLNDTQDFVAVCRALGVTPHVAQNHRGKRKVGWVFTFTAAAYNRVRLRNLAVAA